MDIDRYLKWLYVAILTWIGIGNAMAQPLLTPDQQRRTNQLVSLFEHGTIEIQYDAVEHLPDGRGYTCGRAGFTTATGDALEVVKRYGKQKPDSPLTKFLPELTKLAKNRDDDISKLKTFPDAWKTAASDPVFCDVQDAVIDEWYFQPAMKEAQDHGIETALGKAILFDTIIQHGDGDDQDGLGSILRRTRNRCEGSPKSGKVTEAKFLHFFLATRRATLEHAHDVSTRDTWANSTGRIDVLESLVNAGNFDLKGPLRIRTKLYRVDIP